MQLVEQHVINRSDPRYAAIDAAAFASKNLYNAGNYELRQAFIHEGRFLTYNQLDKLMQSHEAYKQDPSKFLGRPQLPKYKHKSDGRNLLVYTIQALGRRALKRGLIRPSMLPISIKTRVTNINQVRIVPRKGFYVIEVVYQKAITQAPVNPALYAGIDIGMNNLVALTSNKPHFQSIIVNGRPAKSVNQFYNKHRAELQKQLGHTGTTKRMERLSNTRNRRIDHYMHAVNKRIIDVLVQEGIGVCGTGRYHRQDHGRVLHLKSFLA